MLTPQTQPAKSLKTETGRLNYPTPIQITKKEMAEDAKEHVAQGASASESILGIGDDENSQQESESHLEFSEIEEEVVTVIMIIKLFLNLFFFW